jgi:hypothetical protein
MALGGNCDRKVFWSLRIVVALALGFFGSWEILESKML